MTRTGALALLAALAATPAAAQVTVPREQQQTPAPPDARFVIVQSPMAARWTFRLDRFSGQTDRLVADGDSSFAWAPVKRLPHPKGDPTDPGRPGYVLFTSGIAARYTFLLNVRSGATWVLTSGEGDATPVWAPID